LLKNATSKVEKCQLYNEIKLYIAFSWSCVISALI